MIDAASLCIADVTTVLQSIASLKGKVVNVYSEDELIDSTTLITYPAVGVVYEGMRSVEEMGSTNKVGNSCELVVSIILIDTYTKTTQTAAKKQAAPILDKVRELMMANTRRSPTGHKWRFVVEAAATPKQGVVLWVQRWSTPVQLISSAP